MNRAVFAVCLLFAVAALPACTRSSAAPRQQNASTDVQNIDTTPVKPAVFEPPPVLTDEQGAAPKIKTDTTSTNVAPPATPEDEAVRAALPFSPAIGLDPVNGMKISIKAGTPMVEYKNHLYYFTGEDTKKQFLANPEQFTKGIFAH